MRDNLHPQSAFTALDLGQYVTFYYTGNWSLKHDCVGIWIGIPSPYNLIMNPLTQYFTTTISPEAIHLIRLQQLRRKQYIKGNQWMFSSNLHLLCHFL